ncbi:MAG: HAMP domain-containing histidine kinase [Verrucomicrobia bacterium]|nr:HAMP domain-containing histidine kinase [Cytophagales bacterium]
MKAFTLEDSFHTILHDLKSPIHTVLAVSDLYSEELSHLSDGAELDYYETVKHSCHKALHLINELLEVCKTEAEEQSMKMVATDLNKLLENQMRLFSYQAHYKKIKVETFLPDKTIYTLVDIAKFERCLQNLLSNSFKFTHENGNISLSMTQEDNRAVIAVSDTGIGIPEAMMPYIFIKFTPASRRGLYGESSTGLGLYSTKRLVELHGGSISVESQPGKGTCFKVEIPVNEY